MGRTIAKQHTKIPGRTIAVSILLACMAMPGISQITVVQPIPPTATIDIHADVASGPEIPRTLFGTFLEPIGNSTYNGLWAELLQNPSFEAGLWSPQREADMLRKSPELRRASQLALPLPWLPLDARQGNRYEVHYGEAANSWQSLRVFNVPGQATGIGQNTYLPIQRTLEFTGSFYARHISGDATITVGFRLPDQTDMIASHSVKAVAAEWTKFFFHLRVPEGAVKPLEPVEFVVQLQGNEIVDLDQFSLMPADAKDGLDPDVVALAKQMHTPLVRFGGNFTSSYHWTDGIGPRDKRKNMLNNSWGIPEYKSFGTNEFLEFCRLIGAQPQIALNLGSGTPQETASWVRYVDNHWSAHSRLLWELGNELWGNWNLAYPTHKQLAARTAQFSRAVHAANPTARLIATGADPDHFNVWNAIQLTNPPGTFDYLSTHFVVRTDDVLLKNPGSRFIILSAFALPVELGRRLRDAQEQIDATPGYRNKVHLAFTEWLFHGQRSGAPSFLNTGGAIITGGFLNMLMKNAAIVQVSDMTGIMDFAGIWKRRGQVFATPSYYVFKLYAGADIARRVKVDTNAGLYRVSQGVRRLPEIDSVPYLDIVAALNKAGDTFTLFCVNRSLDRDIPANVRFEGFIPAGSANVHTLTSNSLSDENDEASPNRVKPADTVEQIPQDHWTHTFPHASVTVISIRRK